MFLSGSCIQLLLFPKRIAALIVFSCSMFILFFLSLAFKINSCSNGVCHDFVLPTSFQITLVVCLAVSLHCIDACCDCLLQERKVQAQIARKITSVAGSCVSVALLLLPQDFFLFPALIFAFFTLCLGLAVSACWWFLPLNTEVSFREMKKKSATTFLSFSHIGIVVFSAVVGDSADQILDAITNIQIDAFVSGGKVMYVQFDYYLTSHFVML
jgi:hypothetical protein